VDVQWTLSELVAEATASTITLPAPKNGQVRAVPDERTVRYYGTIGLLDRPLAMRGRTALYGRKHLAQVVAIKRLQSAGRSLAEIHELWPKLDEVTLARMSGIELAGKGRATRKEFWKRTPASEARPSETRPSEARPSEARPSEARPSETRPSETRPPQLELRFELAPDIFLVIGTPDDALQTMTPADVRAIHAAAAPLVAELARRGLIAPPSGTFEET
jgi:DNA-binding transcriptional MerR regulator